tara:strand:- start:3179 stop:4642 length:1464 start_codon:yes stop_codon:yes gene_type:complete
MAEDNYTPRLTGIGGDIQKQLLTGAYNIARANAPRYDTLNLIGQGIESFSKEVENRRAENKAKKDLIIGKIDGIVDGIYEKGGSMPQGYYDQAYDYANQLREEYILAEESGDKKRAAQIRGQLNTFSTSIQTTKKSLEQYGETWREDALIPKENMTPGQLNVLNSFTEGNAVLIDGVFQWKNNNYDPSNPNSKEYFTEKDLDKALPLRDDVTKEAYLKDNNAVLESREKWLNGEGGDFDYRSNYNKNMKLIDNSIKTNGIQSLLYDDITGQGSFASTFESDTPHPDYTNFFKNMMTEDGLKNVKAIGLYDNSGDGIIGYEDFIDMSVIPGYSEMDTDGTPGISNAELVAAIEKDPSLEDKLKDLVAPKIKDALLNIDNPSYDENITKKLLNDFLTNRQRQMFYGGDSETYKTLVPNPGGRSADSKNYYRRNKLYINGEEITSLDQYKEMGGSYKYLKEQGYIYDNNEGKWNKIKGVGFGQPTADNIS